MRKKKKKKEMKEKKCISIFLAAEQEERTSLEKWRFDLQWQRLSKPKKVDATLTTFAAHGSLSR